MLTLYGIAGSRASRNMWLLRELELDYQHVPVDDHSGETREPAYLAINPNGKVPLLVDGEVKVFESIAINLHLANKYGERLWFTDVDLQGQAIQWSIWALMEIDENIMRVLTAESGSRRKRCLDDLHHASSVIDKYLETGGFLLGESFSVADLNTAACFSGGVFMAYNFADYPYLHNWLKNCYGRPAANIDGSSIQRFHQLLKES